MDHQILVRMAQGVAYRKHQAAAVLDRVAAGIAVFRDRETLDVFHHEIGQTVGSGSAIEQSRDIGMFETRQNLSLLAEAAKDFFQIGAAADDLDGDEFVELLVHPAGQENLAHAAAAQLPLDPVGADRLPGSTIEGGLGKLHRIPDDAGPGGIRRRRSPPRRAVPPLDTEGWDRRIPDRETVHAGRPEGRRLGRRGASVPASPWLSPVSHPGSPAPARPRRGAIRG